MVVINSVNYRETCFPKPDLTRTPDRPTYESLHQTQLELKANAISVHSNLGGRNHAGHLGLLMTDPQYHALVSNTPSWCVGDVPCTRRVYPPLHLVL